MAIVGHSDRALEQVGDWLRRLHDATATFVPPEGSTWLANQTWRPGLVVGHHDAAPYNAVWHDDELVGFVDWDTAGPSSRELDLAFAALSWVPLLPHPLVDARGYRADGDRSRRLHVLLDSYRYDGDRFAFGATVARRAGVQAAAIRRMATGGDPTYAALLSTADDLELAAREVAALPPTFWRAPGLP